MTDWFSIPNPSASRELRKSKNYEGLRANLVARLERARIHMQVDIGFGDVIVPPPNEIHYPALLNFPSPRLRAYSRETIVAEKLKSPEKLGIANTRMKDFSDSGRLSLS